MPTAFNVFLGSPHLSTCGDATIESSNKRSPRH